MKNRQRNGWSVMFGLIGLVKPLLGFMFLAILMGCLGNLMASSLTVLGGLAIANILGFYKGMKLSVIFLLLGLFAVIRAVLRYSEQASNHFIAFKLLAHIRHMVFASLRRLAPAKLDGKEKGNLISIITSDIELLEVFYAHTISPIAIAIITSIVWTIFIGSFAPILALVAVVAYILVGFVIPVVNSKLGQKDGQLYRSNFGNLNTTVLDNLYGMEEILQYKNQKQRLEKMNQFTEELEDVNQGLKRKESAQRIATDWVIILSGLVMLLVSSYLVVSTDGSFAPWQAMVCTITMMSTFGPVAALSALSNNLNQTLASGNRVLNLLEEEPITEDVVEGSLISNSDQESKDACAVSLKEVDFTYPGASEATLKDFNLDLKPGEIHGILGRSGCGKSTILKLLMRFYETGKGSVTYDGKNVNDITTSSLRNHISYVTQETFLFEDTIENNIKVAKLDATHEEVVEAAKKAAIHDFIMTLPNGYDTVLAELGDSVSGGERQRIGIARAFLHDGAMLLLDEPTSNIDSLNEGIILKSLVKERKDKTIVLVSHRKSTMAIADTVTNFAD